MEAPLVDQESLRRLKVEVYAAGQQILGHLKTEAHPEVEAPLIDQESLRRTQVEASTAGQRILGHL